MREGLPRLVGVNLRWKIFVSLIGVLRPQTPDSTFPTVKLEKSREKSPLKNFSVILSVCWFSKDDGESLHPILLDSFSIFLSVILTQSDKWKIFRLFRAVLYWKLKKWPYTMICTVTINHYLPEPHHKAHRSCLFELVLAWCLVEYTSHDTKVDHSV